MSMVACLLLAPPLLPPLKTCHYGHDCFPVCPPPTLPQIIMSPRGHVSPPGHSTPLLPYIVAAGCQFYLKNIVKRTCQFYLKRALLSNILVLFKAFMPMKCGIGVQCTLEEMVCVLGRRGGRVSFLCLEAIFG